MQRENCNPGVVIIFKQSVGKTDSLIQKASRKTCCKNRFSSHTKGSVSIFRQM